MSDLVVVRNCCMARMPPGEAGLVSELTGLQGETKNVKRFERSNGLDTALYKNYIVCLCAQTHTHAHTPARTHAHTHAHNPHTHIHIIYTCIYIIWMDGRMGVWLMMSMIMMIMTIIDND